MPVVFQDDEIWYIAHWYLITPAPTSPGGASDYVITHVLNKQRKKTKKTDGANSKDYLVLRFKLYFMADWIMPLLGSGTSILLRWFSFQNQKIHFYFFSHLYGYLQKGLPFYEDLLKATLWSKPTPIYPATKISIKVSRHLRNHVLFPTLASLAAESLHWVFVSLRLVLSVIF